MKQNIIRILRGIAYWGISFTWGSPMTLFGVICALGMLISGHKPKRFHYNVYFEVGRGWGGFEAGAFFFVNKGPTLHIRQHEAGHGLQNLVLGVLMPFVVSIPSAIRYWHRAYLVASGKKKYCELPPYDGIWFEGWATSLGEKYFS